MQSGKWSVIRSLYHSNKTRNPKARGTHEFINSVLYNWASNGYIMGDTEGLSECNMIGNHFIYGPSSSSGAHITRTTPSFHVYGADNWIDDNKNGVLDAYQMTDYKTATVVNSPYNYPGVNNLLAAQDALTYVLNNVGASLVRDEVDEFLINQVKSYGTQGQIINTEDDNGINGNVGYVANGTPPTDTDQDGMPDQWEIERGLNPNVADDKGDDDGDGYTNIEEYLSCLVGEGDACTFNPFIDCAGIENGEAYLDECGECVAGTTGKTACVIDCAGVENGSATIDQCGVCSGGTTGIEACKGVLQGENACAYDGSVDSDNEGFQGEGFMNFTNTTGSYGTYYLLSENAQTITVGIRYANGGGSARPMTITVNGNNQVIFQANNTGGWTTWQTENVTLNLAEGTNTLTLTATTGDGGPNLDLFSIPEYISATCEEDCNGDVAGGASLDPCGTCSGGNTGITPNSTCAQEPYGGTPHPIPGTIQFEDFDVGPNGLAYYDDSPGTSTGVEFRTDTDVDIEICTDAGGGYNIGYATAGEWLEYTVNVEETGQYDIDLRVATTGSGKSLSLSMDGTPLVTDLAVASTGDWQAWETITVNDVMLEAGEQILRMTMGAEDYINLNSLTFTKVVPDADNDGTPDSEDACPNDPNKAQSAGTCGCGNLDTDVDADGTPDCIDLCLNDPNKIEPGTCGCDVADVDTDSDGIADCNDNFPEDFDNDGIVTSADCDDTNANIGTATVWYEDTDNDGLGVAGSTTMSCDQPSGYVATAGDECPSDGNKTAPGECGCGATEESCLDCAGTPNGSAYYDNCENCVGGNSGKEACVQDCYGDWGGTAVEDVCGTCSGGNTGITPVTDAQECIATGWEGLFIERVSVYPNPSQKEFTIQAKSNFTYEIHSLSGVLIISGKAETNVTVGQHLSPGMYILTLYETGTSPVTLKLLKQKK